MNIRTLTIYQPWASALIHGLKKFETRPWALKTPGPLAIHAGLADNKEFQVVFEQASIRGALASVGIKCWTDMPRGAILGLVYVPFSVPTSYVRPSIEPLEAALGDFRDERFGISCLWPLIFKNPIPARGHQKIWSWDVPEPLEPTVTEWMEKTTGAFR